MPEKEPSLADPHMDRAVLHAGFSSVMRLLNAMVAQGQNGGPLTPDELQYAMDRGELLYRDALVREAKNLPKKPPVFGE